MAFLRLIRPLNLLIIALTMFGVVFWLGERFYQSEIAYLDFSLLVLSTVMIAAAGNIINDYFDVKADRINKPEKLIITKHIKRRWAIISHWTLNGIAFLIGVVLSIKYETYSFAFIHLISINLLWFYSMVLKRKPLIGNLSVAFLTSLIPVLALIFFLESEQDHFSEMHIGLFSDEFVLIHFLALFAFIQNLSREIIKDIQDIEGDKLIYVRSLPMIIGIPKTKIIVSILLMILPVFAVLSLLVISQILSWVFIDHYFFFAATFFNLIVIILLFSNKGTFKLQDRLIKLSMLMGILSLFQIV